VGRSRGRLPPHPRPFSAPRAQLQRQHALRQRRQRRRTCPSTQILYPNYPHLLSEEMLARISSNRDFNEQELWYLLFTLV
jgi:hypothetical protein